MSRTAAELARVGAMKAANDRVKARRAVAEMFPETVPESDEAGDERYTTRETIAWCMKRAGVDGFDLDVAACEESHHAERYFTKADDGLKQPWAGRVWCNPPYSDIAPWIEKTWAELRAGRVSVVAMLIPGTRTEQKWWQRDVEPLRDRGAELRTHFLPGRTPFARPGSGGVGQSGSPFGCVLLVWRQLPGGAKPCGRET